ncbi:hypothetical protein B0J13DRAFT_250252 [Dactylonectria estremocensis]|uniref:Uncharacterized protein n=1 Tax=Dactylonectria estremocensis TaxID=1079267 RepID=A0A9P9F398_9HYPO|nr:hypothetical protein B0J13DRAFT_250252 [Dactylonectria estremocensis]
MIQLTSGMRFRSKELLTCASSVSGSSASPGPSPLLFFWFFQRPMWTGGIFLHKLAAFLVLSSSSSSLPWDSQLDQFSRAATVRGGPDTVRHPRMMPPTQVHTQTRRVPGRNLSPAEAPLPGLKPIHDPPQVFTVLRGGEPDMLDISPRNASRQNRNQGTVPVNATAGAPRC